MEADVSEANVAKLIDGQPAEVSVEAFPDRRYKAVLRQIIPTADRTKATVLTKVTLIEKDKDLKPEMSAKVTFLEPRGRSAPRPPTCRPSRRSSCRRARSSRATAARRCSRSSRARPCMRAITTGVDAQRRGGRHRRPRRLRAARLEAAGDTLKDGDRSASSSRRSASRQSQCQVECSRRVRRLREFALATSTKEPAWRRFEVQNVRKVYKRDSQDIVVLDGLSLEVPEGEFVALMGPVGLRQDDAAQPDRGDRPPDVRQGRRRGHRRRRSCPKARWRSGAAAASASSSSSTT